jgi:phage terminase large subunit
MCPDQPLSKLEEGVIGPLPGPQTIALSIGPPVKEILFGGARGGGKTYAGFLWLLKHVSNAKYRALVIRRNYTDLCDWLDRAMQIFHNLSAKNKAGDISFPSGAVIRTGHLKDTDAYQKYQGHEYQQMLIEELTQIPDEESYLKLLASCRSTVPELKPMTFATSNPGGPGHYWVKERFRVKNRPGVPFLDINSHQYRIFIPSRLSDNPYLGDDYRVQLEALPDHLKRAWLDGDWDALSGRYFTEFDPNQHVVQPFNIPEHYGRYVGMDWGYAPDPWVVLWFAVDENGQVVLYREAWGNNQTPEEVGHMITKMEAHPITMSVADPSMWAKRDGISSAEKLSATGFNIIPANNDRVNGWMRVHELLRKNPVTGKPNLRIFSSCTKTIESLNSLVHDDTHPMDCAEHPLDHWADALRYFSMSRYTAHSAPQALKPWNSLEMLKYKHENRLIDRR